MSSAKQFLLSFLICLLVFGTVGFFINKYYDDMLKENDEQGKVDPDITDIGNANDDLNNISVGKGFSALVVGCDLSNPDMDRKAGIYEEADAIMIITIDRKENTYYLWSIDPNSVYDFTVNDETVELSYKNTLKFFGIDALRTRISCNSGLKIDYYAVIDTEKAKSLYAKFCFEGGIMFDIGNKSWEYDDLVEKISVPSGLRARTSKEAVDIMRYIPEEGNGELLRNKNQTEVVNCFIKTALKPNSTYKTQLLSEDERTSLLKGIETNVTAQDILENIDLVFSLSLFDSVTGTDDGRLGGIRNVVRHLAERDK